MNAIRNMIPIAVPNIDDSDRESVVQTMRDGWVSTVGPAVDEFEKALAQESGTPLSAAVAAGTMGLHVALVAIGVGRDDLVLCPSYSFIATANAIAHAGARPFFVDIDPASWCLCPNKLDEVLTTSFARDRTGALRHRLTGRRAAAVMPVYTMGTPADMDAIVEVTSRHGLPVVADAAAAIGARYRGRPIGDLADLSVYSFNGNKTITTGGGAVTGPDKRLVERVKHLASTARVGHDYDHDEVAFNYRMTALEAALGRSQIARLPSFLTSKRHIRETYATAFKETGLTAFPSPDWAQSAYWFSGCVLPPLAQIDIEEACKALRARGIGTRVFWKPLHLRGPHKDALRGSLRETEMLWDRVLVLPSSTHITEDELSRVIEAVRAVIVPAL